MTLADDPLWQRFNNADMPCACCGRRFEGVFDIGFDHPDPWTHGNRQDSGQDVMEHGEDRLTADFCSIGPHRFIRAVLRLPIIGADQDFAFGTWASVNPANYETYLGFTSQTAQFEGCFAWAMNRLPGFVMEDWLPCNLMPGRPGERPYLEVHDGAHELAALQESGISFDRLLDIYAASGQDLRPHLSAV